MKSHLSLLISVFLLLFNSCISDGGPFIEGNGEVVINVATRGSYQFLILYEKEHYFPENLPEEFKVVSQDPKSVFIRFKLTDEEADIFIPAPNDVPILLKSIPVIRLAEIKRR